MTIISRHYWGNEFKHGFFFIFLKECSLYSMVIWFHYYSTDSFGFFYDALLVTKHNTFFKNLYSSLYFSFIEIIFFPIDDNKICISNDCVYSNDCWGILLYILNGLFLPCNRRINFLLLFLVLWIVILNKLMSHANH